MFSALRPCQTRKHCHMTFVFLQMFHEIFPSLATLSYHKIDAKIVIRMFDYHQTFRVTFHVV